MKDQQNRLSFEHILSTSTAYETATLELVLLRIRRVRFWFALAPCTSYPFRVAYFSLFLLILSILTLF